MTPVENTLTSHEADTYCRVNSKEMEAKQPQMISDTPEAINSEWDIRSAKIIPVPADGLCMYHCVYAGPRLDEKSTRIRYVTRQAT